MPRRLVPIIGEETAICQDCLLPFRKVVGSRRVICSSCAGFGDLSKRKIDNGESFLGQKRDCQ